MNTYRNIDRSKIQFDFIVHTQKPCAYDNEIRVLGGRVYNALPRYTGFNHFEYVHKWQEFFKEHPEYRLIHGHVRSTAAIYLYIAGKYGLTTIAHTHNTSSGTGLACIARELLKYPIRYLADYMFACSEAAGEFTYGKGCKKNYRVVKNAIDTDNFKYNEPVRAKLRAELALGESFLIGHVGRFEAQKNHTFIIDIFEQIVLRNKTAKLILIGAGELLEEIAMKAKNKGVLEKIIFTGVKPNVFEYLQAMDVILFPSLYEGLPVAIVESQAAGLPHVLSDSISDEIDMGMNLIEFISLDKPAEFWAERILRKQNFKRVTDIQKIIANGYDIQENARFLQEFYLQNS